MTSTTHAASGGLFDDLLQEDAPASSGLFDDLLAEAPPRRGGTVAETRRSIGAEAPIPTQADARRAEPQEPAWQPSVLDRAGAPATGDPMLRPEFVQELRSTLAPLPPERRMGALQEMSRGTDVRARAARELLRQVEVENAPVTPEREAIAARLPAPGYAERVAVRGKLPPAPTGAPSPVPVPSVAPSFADMMDGMTPQQIAQRRVGAQRVAAAEAGIEAMADSAERRDRDFQAEAFAAENPTLGALASGAARQWRGAVNVVPTVMDFAARMAGVDTSGVNSESEYSARLKRQADSYMPKVGRQEMGQAWDKGEFGGWLLTNLVAQAPQIAQSVVAAYIPGAAPMALTAMGAQAAGGKFADTRDSAAAVSSGLVEAGSEMLPLAAFRRSYDALSKLPPAARGEVLQAIGRALPQVGKAITSQAITGAIEEVAAEVGNNAIDLARGESKSLLDGVASAAVIGAVASKALSVPQAAGALVRAGESGEAQFARALEQDVGDTFFRRQPVDEYARRAGSADFYDPSVVDPATQRAQFNGEQPAAPAGRPAGSQGTAPGGQQATAATPASDQQVRAAPVVPRVEDMPTTPMTAEQIAALAERARAGEAEHEQPATAPAGDPADLRRRAAGLRNLGVPELALVADQMDARATEIELSTAPLPTGQRRQRRGRGRNRPASALNDKSQGVGGTPTGSTPSEAAPMAPQQAGSGQVLPTIERGSLAAEAQRALAARKAAQEQPGLPQQSKAKTEAAPEAPQVVEVSGPASAPPQVGDSRSTSADIRREFSARYERQRAESVEAIARLRSRAEELRNAGSPKLTKQAAAIERRAALLESSADLLPVLSMPPRAAAASFRRLQDALHDAFGRRVVAYYDNRESAVDGFAEDGVAFVNLARPDRSVAFTAFHELQHLVRKEAEAGDAKAQAATQMLDQVWAMIDPAAKRQYAEQYLFRDAIRAGSMTLEQALASPTLRDEMLSDFMGKRATDESFMRQLAEKNPSQFQSFARRWIEELGRLIKSLKGRWTKDDDLDVGGLKDLDLAIVDLERAKLVAEKVLKAWADSKPQQDGPSQPEQISRREASAREEAESEDPGIGATVDDAMKRGGMSRSAREPGVIAEVAPNPDKPEAQAWRELDPEQRQYVTKEVMDSVWPQLMRELGWPKATYTFGSGTFEGEVNPNVSVSMPEASFEDVVEMARVLGYVLDQKAMVAFDESDTSDGAQAAFVKVIPPAGMSTAQVESLRRSIAQAVPQASGDTVRDGAIIYGNFSELSDQAFEDAIVAAVEKMPDRIEVLPFRRYRSEYIQPASRDAYLEGTRYGGGEAALEAGRDDVRGRQGGDPGRLKAIAERAVKRRDDRVAYARAGGAARGGGVRPVKPEGLRDRPRVTFGEPRANSVEVDAFHYSQAPRSSLSTAAYGTGLRGSLTDKIMASADPRLRQRAYFYANKGEGIHPEAGVGGYMHRVLLRNIYDQDSDQLKLLRGMDREAFEAGVLDAGFDGYLYRDHNRSAAVVVLGPKAVPVELQGQFGAVDAGQVVPPTGRRNSMRELGPEDKSELGAFDPFRGGEEIEVIDMDAALDVDGDAAPMSDAEMEEINAELQAEQQWASTDRVVYDYQGPSDEALASAGIMAESAYQPLPYRRDGTTDIRFHYDGKHYGFRLFNNDTGASAVPQEGLPGPGAAMGLRGVSEAAAEAYNRRVAASIDLTRRGFDLFTAVPSAARTRVKKAWETISGMSGAFQLSKVDPLAIKGRPAVAMLQAFADQMLAGTGYRIDASKPPSTITDKATGRASSVWMAVDVYQTVNGRETGPQQAEIEYIGGSDPRITLRAIGLTRGSGAGKMLYQVMFAWAHELGLRTVADPSGLTAVNSTRRTEQQMAAAARSGSTLSVGTPGTGQRVYGWNPRPKDKVQHDRNLVRLALASARNAAESVPAVRDMAYSLSADTFTWRRGENKGGSAEDFVKQALRDKDVRAMSVSRSMLARAAVTFSAIDGELKLDPDAPIKSPILYSARGDIGEYAVIADPFDGDYKRLDGRMVSLAVTTTGTGRPASMELGAGAYLRSLTKRLAAVRRIRDCLT